jgi:hypothetical protein
VETKRTHTNSSAMMECLRYRSVAPHSLPHICTSLNRNALMNQPKGRSLTTKRCPRYIPAHANAFSEPYTLDKQSNFGEVRNVVREDSTLGFHVDQNFYINRCGATFPCHVRLYHMRREEIQCGVKLGEGYFGVVYSGSVMMRYSLAYIAHT